MSDQDDRLASPQPIKSLALPIRGRNPSFAEVSGIALTGALLGMSVCVICLTESALAEWQKRLEEKSSLPASLHVLDAHRATLTDWEGFLRGSMYDMVVLQGAGGGLQEGWLSPGYVKALVEAIPRGLILVA